MDGSDRSRGLQSLRRRGGMTGRMADVVCVGDVHEGVGFGFLVDPETGVSARALDLHRNFVAAASWAIEHSAKLFCVLGDLFDRTHVAPVFREMVRRAVIEPLGEAGIEVWLLAGNHDQPRAFARSTSLDDYRGYRHVKVFREPATEGRELGGSNGSRTTRQRSTWIAGFCTATSGSRARSPARRATRSCRGSSPSRGTCCRRPSTWRCSATSTRTKSCTTVSSTRALRSGSTGASGTIRRGSLRSPPPTHRGSW